MLLPCTVHFVYNKITPQFAMSHTSGFVTSSPAIYLYSNYYHPSNPCKGTEVCMPFVTQNYLWQYILQC
jgi:hypothetical protein